MLNLEPILPFVRKEEGNRLLSLQARAHMGSEERRWFALALERVRYALFLSLPEGASPMEEAFLLAHRGLLAVEDALWQEGGYGFRALDLLLLWRRMGGWILAQEGGLAPFWAKEAAEGLMETAVFLSRFPQADLLVQGEGGFLEKALPQEEAIHRFLEARGEAFLPPGALGEEALRHDLEALSLWYEEEAWALESLPQGFRQSLPYGKGSRALAEAWKVFSWLQSPT